MKHLSTFYSNDETKCAEIFSMDEHTYAVKLYEDTLPVSQVYFNTLQDAEDGAEDFVMEK